MLTTANLREQRLQQACHLPAAPLLPRAPTAQAKAVNKSLLVACVRMGRSAQRPSSVLSPKLRARARRCCSAHRWPRRWY